ncbi:hypothetical protein NSA50_02275 [Clostridium sp. DSM 100503]|uniref:hypothetical protein n=1 Tax=Clostridium sp. DSM 100503 TaxID=2963282 RepID=UPI002149B9A4|nr:hypothetical protein [Clostridium sp. DSM 100503]MCR1949885.1 hypothetical protein [Clostridium sp. DSM 100503]
MQTLLFLYVLLAITQREHNSKLRSNFYKRINFENTIKGNRNTEYYMDNNLKSKLSISNGELKNEKNSR